MTVPNIPQCPCLRGVTAFDNLPGNWTGLCASAMLIPDEHIILGDGAVSEPFFDFRREI